VPADVDSSATYYNPFGSMQFTSDKCFLCGAALSDARTVEHVFPKWLQARHNLWDQRVDLLNETDIPYRQLVIPCCARCNTAFLAPLEETISAHLDAGYDSFLRLDRLRIYQWVAKIQYGILFKELSLLLDRKTAGEGFIVTPEQLELYSMTHFFLQSLRLPMEFVGFHPWSIFIVKTHAYEDHWNFDYHDEVLSQTFSIRMGEVGIVACLEDNGTQEKERSDMIEEIKGISLHPLQFDELHAMVAYQQQLMNRVPKYVIMRPEDSGQPIRVTALPLGGWSVKPIYEDWDVSEYARFLLTFWSRYGIRLESFFRPPDLIASYLYRDDGSLMRLDLDGRLMS
jgi:hypothetical protein